MDERRILVYCRESRDEGGLLRGRIETQREMLLKYAKEMRLGKVVKVITDDDMTGTDFSRLDVVRELAKSGEIDAILLKDSSRLGRNLTESLLFTEFLREVGVELIFESEVYNEDIFPLEAWFHEMRAKEDSRKIRSVVYHKMREGVYLVAPPYGYLREGTKLLPDPECAGVVEEIFRDFLSGASVGEIAGRLNARELPPPSLYKGRRDAKEAWSAAGVRHILENESYTGSRVMKKTVGASFKDKRRLTTSRDERIILENDHEPLVTRADFEKAASRLASSGRGGGEKTPYAGLLFCGGCGGRLILRRKKGRKPVYVCAAYNRYGNSACTAHRVAPEEIESAVRGAAYGAYFLINASDEVEETLPSLEELYEDLAAGHITRAFFEKMRARVKAPARKEVPFDPAGHEEKLAPLLIGRITACEKGEKGHRYASLEIETRF